jgi:hypothetical protein
VRRVFGVLGMLYRFVCFRHFGPYPSARHSGAPSISGVPEIDTLASKSATADLVGGSSLRSAPE